MVFLWSSLFDMFPLFEATFPSHPGPGFLVRPPTVTPMLGRSRAGEAAGRTSFTHRVGPAVVMTSWDEHPGVAGGTMAGGQETTSPWV